MVRDKGFIAARNGTHSYEGLGSHLMGSSDNVEWIQTWDFYCRYEFDTSGVSITRIERNADSYQGLYDFLYDTVNVDQTALDTPYGSTPYSPLYGYDSVMEGWKDNNFWWNFYFHSTTEISVEQLEWLIDILMADDEVWIADFETIATYANQHHAPYGSSKNDELIYEPLIDHGTSPWNGHKMAVSFSMDDPQTLGVDNLMPVLLAKDCPFTIFCTGGNLEGGATEQWTDAELITFYQLGVNIGAHGMTHDAHFHEGSMLLTDPDRDTKRKGFKITADGNDRTIEFYQEA